MKEKEYELSGENVDRFSYDEADQLRTISELVRRDTLRYKRRLDAEEDADEN